MESNDLKVGGKYQDKITGKTVEITSMNVGKDDAGNDKDGLVYMNLHHEDGRFEPVALHVDELLPRLVPPPE